jgi:hypothetical protein
MIYESKPHELTDFLCSATAWHALRRSHTRSGPVCLLARLILLYLLAFALGAACELEGLPPAFAGLLPHSALSSLIVERKSEI